MKGRKSFELQKDYIHTIELMPDNKAGKLIKHIFRYAAGENPQTDDLIINAVFAFIKQDMDEYFSRHKQGDSHPLWKGGVSKENAVIRNSSQTRFWRKMVLKRDKYACRHCGSKKVLHAHHIKPFISFPELRFSVDNGLTLCRKCHIKEHKRIRKHGRMV